MLKRDYNVKNSKTFNHNLVDRIELESYYTETSRVYVTPEGNHYESVTSIIGQKSDHSWLEEWRDRVGIDNANKITYQACFRGTAIHDMAEKYVLNKDEPLRGHGAINISDFNNIVPILNEHVNNIYGIEIPLYDDELKTAGRSDVIGQYDNENSVIDFKTSRYIKKKEDILGYFIQSSCYAHMFEKKYGIKTDRIAIIMTVNFEPPIVFIENKNNYMNKVYEFFRDR